MAFDRELAAMTLFCEASGEAPSCRRKIAWSLFNRLRLGRYGSTIAAVCLKRMQYSEWNADAVDNANLLRAAGMPETDKVMMDCLSAYQEALVRQGVDPSNGATHFYAKSIPAPSWTAQATLCAQDGNLLFWRDVP